ncbi:MAG TPA: DNA mismatch repair endonuclease MutL [Lacipirellulaceae bacterium]|nr:DNA mismatch repair endonuclease MutL [Lacipirellulaceae bacterium]
MPTIQQLPSSVVNKIAAGEVIERPASVVKELLENSVDAGATRIDVTIEKGGSEMIRVADNGCGIAEHELPLAIASHATSKIRSADDLFAVGTLGFRGEALASIAEVSRLVIRSRTADAPSGAELEVVGGAAQPLVPVGSPVGTTIEIRNLFFNTPVRHKFLRSAQTEMGHSIEAVTRLALAHPAIHFTLSHNGRLVHDLPPVGGIRGRIAAFFGDELAADLIEIHSESDRVALSGFVANPMHSRATGRMQYLFLNGRAIRDRALQHALTEAYRGLLLTGRQPICFLRLDMPTELVDVNVHPTKQEVRFQDSGRLYSQLLGTLRTKFLTTDLTARGASPTGYRENDVDEPDGAAAGASELVEWAKQQLGKQLDHAAAPMTADMQRAGSSSTPAFGAATYRPAREEFEPAEPLRLHRIDVRPFQPFDIGRASSGSAAAEPHADLPHGMIRDFGATTPRNALQVHNRYLVVETDTGIEVIDQHALHERILYEQIREKVLGGALESQKLLVPEPVDLTASEAAAVLEHADLLAQLGVEVQPFGGETVLVSSYPAMLANLSPAEVLRELVEKLLSGGRQPEPRDLLDDLLHMIACKAAVKFGDRLTGEEIEALLAQRHLAQDDHHCPHGRPTALVFTREDLDRQFKRI